VNPASLKILIAATPKTGNVWLKSLLAETYGLREVDIDTRLTHEDLKALGNGWVAHQHLSPTPRLWQLLTEHQVLVFTLFRHPGDVLVSLKAFIAHLDDPHASDPNAATMLADGDTFGSHTLNYVRSAFPNLVNLSLLWRGFGAHPIRYEELRQNPQQTLRYLTDHILPTSTSQIERAVEATSLERMRRKHAKRRFHFREGKTGGWTEILPAEIKTAFRTLRPYPAQFRALGYSIAPDASASAGENPDSGPDDAPLRAPSCPFLENLFRELPETLRNGWLPPSEAGVTGPYLEWLLSPCDAETGAPKPAVSNLALAIHRRRPDLQRAYPEPTGADRIDFLTWFITRSAPEYGLDLAYRAGILEQIAWLDRQSLSDL